MAHTDLEVRSDDHIWIGSRDGLRTCLLDGETYDLTSFITLNTYFSSATSEPVAFRDSGDVGVQCTDAGTGNSRIVLAGRSDNRVKLNGKVVQLDQLQLAALQLAQISDCW